MKLLHTSDWHVGKKIRGQSRAEEHRAVLDEIVDIARAHEVDVVLVAGDLFETASPTPESEEIVFRTLMAFAEMGAHVFVIAGNHDNGRRLEVLQPLMALGGIHVIGEVTKPEDGGVVEVEIGDERLIIASLPFVSQSRIVRATDLMENAAFEHAGAYADRMRSIIDALSADFGPDTVNLLLMHGFVLGGASAGGERAAHLIEEYAVTAASFPVSASYVALGHLHANQKIPGGTAIHYSGSPLQLDFGDSAQRKAVNVIDVRPGAPAKVDAVQLSAGIPLRTLRGDLDSLRAQAGDMSDEAWLRVVVKEARRSDLAEDVRSLLGERVVDVVVDAPDEPRERTSRQGRSPVELFAEYLQELQIEEPAITTMFAELLESTGTD